MVKLMLGLNRSLLNREQTFNSTAEGLDFHGFCKDSP